MYFEFTDSEVAQCTWKAGCLQLRFTAAKLQKVHKQSADTVWAPLLLLAGNVESRQTVVDLAACMGRLNHGVVMHTNRRFLQLPVPCELQGEFTMELEFAQGAVLGLRGHSLSLLHMQGAMTGAYQC